MTQISASPTHPLVERLSRLRSRVRLILALFGIGVLVSAMVASILFLMYSDYLLHLSNQIRFLLLLVWLTCVGTVCLKFVINPLLTRLTDQFLASRVENLHKGLSDELMSAVHFIHAGTFQTNALAAQHVDAAAKKTGSIRFEEAIDFRRSTKALLVAFLITFAATLVAAFNPQLTRIALSRWFTGSPLDWPRVTTVTFEWPTKDGNAPRVLPIGEQVLLRAKVIAGGSPSQRVWLTNWSDNHTSATDLMTYQAGMSSPNNYIYERTLEPNGEKSFSLKLQSGDDTEQPALTIPLAPRPMITQLSAAISPPGYVKNISDSSKPAPIVIADLLTQSGRAVEGATISLRISATKPFLTNANGEPELRLLDQNKDEEIPLTASKKLVEPNVALLTFSATKTLQARVAMRDTDDFENRVGGTLSIEVVPDSLPSVVITDPRRLVERTPTSNVDIAVQATDDLGLDGLKLVADKFDAKPGEPPVFQADLSWADRAVDSASGNTTGHSTYTWNLSVLTPPLQPGTRLSFYAMVQDNYDVNGTRHPWVKSPPVSLQIRSEADIADARRRDLNEVKERIRALDTQQTQTRSQTDAIQKSAAASGVTTPQQKSQLADLAQQQSEQAASANAIQQRVEQIGDDLKQNNLGENELGKLSAEVATGMKDVARNNMPAAASELNKARESAGNQSPNEAAAKEQAKQAAASAANASAQQSNAIATMDRLLDSLGAAGDFEAVRNELNKIKDQQDKLDQQTRELATQTIGQDADKLPQAMRDKLNDVAARQSALANQTSELIQKMDKAADQLKPTDPAASDSLQKASQAGQQNQVSSSQGSAGKELSQNQTHDASNSQAQAQRGLQQMQDELDKNERSQLEQLARQLQELLEQVKQLRTNEDAVNKDTIAAGAAPANPVMQKLGDRQGQLQMNTIVVQKKAESTRSAQPAAGNIHEAADHMSEAAANLYSVKQPASLTPETQAVASLDEAIKKLEAAKQKVDNQLKDKDLAEFVKEYQEIQTNQKTVKGSSDTIASKRLAASDKQIDRLGLIQLAKLAVTQSRLNDQINHLSTDEKLKDFPVVVWMNGLISESMSASTDRMKKADTAPALASAQQTAIDRIQDIIDALKEEQKRQSDFENQSAGGGGGGGGKQPLVPPLAQLKLLKAMQLVINSQTADVSKSIDMADQTVKPDLQQQAAKLGQKQGEIKDIANKIMDQMKQQQ